MAKYGERGHLMGEDASLAIVTRLKDGVDGGVAYGPLQAPIWNRSVDIMGSATSQSDGAPTPGV